MHKPNDKAFHSWVQQTLHNHQPEFNPQDWTKMQRALRWQRWLYWGKVASVSLTVVGLISWWVWEAKIFQQTPTKAVISTVPKGLPLAKDSVASFAGQPPNPVQPAASDLPAITLQPSPQRREISIVPKQEGSQFQMLELAPLESRSQIVELFNPLVERKYMPLLPVLNSEKQAIKYQMLTGSFGSDSTTYEALARNLRRWPNAVVVCDLTSSMYPYSTQIFAWFKKNAKHPEVKGIVFFTDCDSLGQKTRPNGPAGQMFVTSGREISAALPMMLEAADNTRNNDDAAENDVEALLFAQKRFPEASHLILLADNASGVKDMALLGQITKPVHVVLCRETEDSTKAYQPEFYTIAKQTKGSLHTLEDDINPSQMDASTWMKVGDRYYHYNARKDRFKVTRFRQRPRSFLGLLWY